MRYHARHRAVVVVATTADGTVTTVQRVHLTEPGCKIDEAEVERRELPAVKVTNGVQAGAAVRLPGDPAGPLLVAEGPETGLAVWSSTRLETLVALGSVAKIDPPMGRLVVIIADDNPPASDPKHGGAERALQGALAEWTEAGHRVVVVRPWDTRREDGSDLADLILEHGADAVASRIQAAIASAPHTDDQPTIQDPELVMDESAGQYINGFNTEHTSYAECSADDAETKRELEPDAAADDVIADTGNVTSIALEKAYRLPFLDYVTQREALAESLNMTAADLNALRRKHEAEIREAKKAQERAEAQKIKEAQAKARQNDKEAQVKAKWDEAQKAKAAKEAQAKEKEARQDRAKAALSEIDKVVSRLNDEFMVVNEAGKALIYQRGEHAVLKRRVFDRLSTNDLKTLYMNERIAAGVDAEGNPKMRTVASVWLNHPNRRQYIKGVTFDPTNQTPDGVLNLWEGFGVKPVPGDWSLLKNHIEKVLCSGNQEQGDYFLNWLARLVQFPAQQGEVAVVLRGVEGCGKGTVASAVKTMIGHHALAINNAKHLVGNFNSHLRDVVFLFADEAFFAGDKQHIGVLKSLITESSLTIEPKYVNAVEVPNFLHVMMASNEEWVVPADLRSRRFYVLNVPDTYVGNYPYFEAIRKQMDAGGHEAMLHELLNRDISNFNVRIIPQTEGLEQQRHLSLDTLHTWWFDCLERGYVFQSKLGLEKDFSIWDTFFSTELLYKSYSEFAKLRNERRPCNRVQLGKFLTQLGGKAGQHRGGIVGEHRVDEADATGRIIHKTEVVTSPKPPGYSFGDLKAARAGFVGKTKISVEWDNGVADFDDAPVDPTPEPAAADPASHAGDDEWLSAGVE